jgi:hypothetical protein
LLQSHQENLRNHLLTLEKERIRAVRIKSWGGLGCYSPRNEENASDF